ASCSLGQVLKLGAVDEQELYEALDWLRGEQGRIEQALARRHLRNGMLVLYDVTSTYFEGRTCPLAKLGYSRDGKRHKLQIVFGLLCTLEGAARSPSKCSKATLAIRPHCRARLTSSGSGSGSNAWC